MNKNTWRSCAKHTNKKTKFIMRHECDKHINVVVLEHYIVSVHRRGRCRNTASQLASHTHTRLVKFGREVVSYFLPLIFTAVERDEAGFTRAAGLRFTTVRACLGSSIRGCTYTYLYLPTRGDQHTEILRLRYLDVHIVSVHIAGGLKLSPFDIPRCFYLRRK